MFRLDPNSKVGRFVQHVVPGVIKPLHSLWHEIIGFLFLVLAVIPARSLINEWREFNQRGDNLSKLLLGLVWVLIMAYFGITSFLRARKISRS